MITREEALKFHAFCLVDDRVSLYLERHINEIYDSFESQLSSNPLQLTCEGCYYYDKYEHFNYCDGCTRHSDAGSFAELKDKFTKDTK